MNVRIGIINSAREIEVDVEDEKAFVKSIEDALTGDGGLVWAESHGDRIGLVVAHIAYIQIEGDRERIVGL
ncbi:MAG: DUF3107 domain-containing protein [Acidimicrobiia bacterium]|nr:DUF3107 domain-containing protein [Acidimicrobiia bacterium]MBT8249038.1 DUF3107 domain-containing protein [Acidimicrobiia bacterium]NNC43655.1 DUF3107 family protein [Acidimicrobiia bacterium]NND13709.1 DUF3107 family protein [Acidimicrobiia bacterium]NNL27210.1 DUF3107 family protein [Acidimicrobiia bacterium]